MLFGERISGPSKMGIFVDDATSVTGNKVSIKEQESPVQKLTLPKYKKNMPFQEREVTQSGFSLGQGWFNDSVSPRWRPEKDAGEDPGTNIDQSFSLISSFEQTVDSSPHDVTRTQRQRPPADPPLSENQF